MNARRGSDEYNFEPPAKRDPRPDPTEGYGFSLTTFLDRLTNSLSFQAEAISNHAQEAIAAFHASNPRAAMESIVLRYANEALDMRTKNVLGIRAMTECCDNYCHVFEVEDRMGRREAA